MRKLFLSLVLFTAIYSTAFAQGQANHWYFGQNAGLDFTNGAPVAVTNGALSTSEGCSAISTAGGQLLFYTDGVTVYDNTHQAMPNSGDLDGNVSTTQSALIVPRPGSSTLFYIFTLDADGGPLGFRYSMVDMTLQNNHGDVTGQKNILICDSATEKVSAVKTADGSSYWIMMHQWGTNAFRAYRLSAAGLDTVPVISHTGSVHNTSLIQNTYGQMKFSPGGERLALAVDYQGIVELFHFNDTTGAVSNSITLGNGDRYYGLEFSQDNSKLYVTHYNLTWDTYYLDQYDISSGNAATIAASISNIASADYYRALQLGPDGKIYVDKAFSGFLGQIISPDSLGTSCNYLENAIDLTGMSSALGLPGFVQTWFKKRSHPTAALMANDTGTCAHTCLYFSDLSLNDPTQWHWSFPGASPDTSSQQNPGAVCYDTPGDYAVTLICSNSIGADTVALPDYIHVGPAAPQPVITQFGNVLNCSAASSYQWYLDSLPIPGATNQVYALQGPGAYWVVVTNANGCTATSDTLYFGESGIAPVTADNGPRLFPVPATNVLFIYWSGHSATVRISDELGRVLRECPATAAGNRSVYVGDLTDGLYFVHFAEGNKAWDRSFVKQ